LPQLLSAKDRVSWKASPFASLKIRPYLVRASLEAGQLRLAYREGQAALDLIEQLAGYVLLKGYFEITQIEVWYQWNRLEEARNLLHTVMQDATTWQHLNLLAGG
jgi:LuxR family maltose regulon positive regulatory protein